MSDHSPRPEPIQRFVASLNANTILILLLFAAMWYLSNVFVTKEIYYRDQLKIEQTFKEVKEGETRILDILTRQQERQK